MVDDYNRNRSFKPRSCTSVRRTLYVPRYAAHTCMYRVFDTRGISKFIASRSVTQLVSVMIYKRKFKKPEIKETARV